jgi:ubiquinone/menaquinone biosynthesis C-methylase UbiE
MEDESESGRVYASDIDAQALQYLKKRIEKEKLKNVHIIKGREDDPLLPAGQMDLVLIVNTIHLVKQPGKFLNRITASLK